MVPALSLRGGRRRRRRPADRDPSEAEGSVVRRRPGADPRRIRGADGAAPRRRARGGRGPVARNGGASAREPCAYRVRRMRAAALRIVGDAQRTIPACSRSPGVEHRYGATPRSARCRRGAPQPAMRWLLAGASGSGKSTLLHILAGLTTPTAGHGDRRRHRSVGAVASSERDRWRGRTVGLVPQRLHLVGALTVRDNLRLAQYLAGLPDRSRSACARCWRRSASPISRTGFRASCRRARRSASRSRVRSSIGPRSLLADEPTANLDDAHAAQALELLRAQAIERRRDAGRRLARCAREAAAAASFALPLHPFDAATRCGMSAAGPPNTVQLSLPRCAYRRYAARGGSAVPTLLARSRAAARSTACRRRCRARRSLAHARARRAA